MICQKLNFALTLPLISLLFWTGGIHLAQSHFAAPGMSHPASRGRQAPLLTDTFLRQGGQHIQYNLMDAKELLDAKAHPEKHQDLLVRVGGFSAYFCNSPRKFRTM